MRFYPSCAAVPTACAPISSSHHHYFSSPLKNHHHCHQGNIVRECHLSFGPAQSQGWWSDTINSTTTTISSWWNGDCWTKVRNATMHMYATTSDFGLRGLSAARDIGIRTATSISDFLKELCIFIVGRFVTTSSVLKMFVDMYTHKLIDYIGSMLQNAKDYASANTLGFVLSAFSIVFSIFTCLNKDYIDNVEGILCMVLTGVALYLKRPTTAMICAPTAVRYILSLFSRAQPQGPKDDFKKLLINAFTCAAILKCETAGLNIADWSPKNLEEMMKRTALVGRSLQTWNLVADKFADFFDDLLCIVSKYLYKTEYYSTRKIAELESWVGKVMQFISLGNQMKVGRDKDAAIEIEALYTQYLIFRTRYAGNRKATELLNTYGHVITELYNKVCNKNPNAHKMRQEPVCVVLRGGAGIGKSYLMDSLKEDLLKICGRYNGSIDPDAAIYSRCHEQEFWDGYAGQPIVIFDDGFQQVDSVANPNPEFFEIIRSVNIFPYNLHSANLHEKANNPFNSEFVVVTTNLTNFKPSSIHSEDALIRRLHIVVDLTLIPEVCNVRGGVDSVKLRRYREAHGLPTTDMSHLVFKIHRLDDSVETGSYDDFVVAISREYQSHEESFHQRQQNSEVRKREKLPAGCYTKDRRWAATSPTPTSFRSRASTLREEMSEEEKRQREVYAEYMRQQQERLDEQLLNQSVNDESSEESQDRRIVANVRRLGGVYFLTGNVFVPISVDSSLYDNDGDSFYDAGEWDQQELGQWRPVMLQVRYDLTDLDWELCVVDGIPVALCAAKKWFITEQPLTEKAERCLVVYTPAPSVVEFQAQHDEHKGRYIKMNQFASLNKKQQTTILQMRWIVWYSNVQDQPDMKYAECHDQEQFEAEYAKSDNVPRMRGGFFGKRERYYEVPSIVLAKAVRAEEFENFEPTAVFVERLEAYYKANPRPEVEEESWTYQNLWWMLASYFRWVNWLNSSKVGLLATLAIAATVCAALAYSMKSKFEDPDGQCYNSVISATFWGILHRETWICAAGNLATGSQSFNPLSRVLMWLEPCLYVLRHSRFHQSFGITQCKRCFSAKAQASMLVEELKRESINLDEAPKSKSFSEYDDPLKRTIEEDIKYYMGSDVNVEDVKQTMRPGVESSTHYSEVRKVRPRVEKLTPVHIPLTKALEESGRACDPTWRKKREFEAPYSTQSHDMLTKCMKNHVMLHIQASSNSVERELYVGQIFVVSGRVALINNHYISTMDKMLRELASFFPKEEEPMVSIFVRAPNMPAKHWLAYEDLVAAPTVKRGEIETEFRVLRLPHSLPARCNLVPQFIAKKELGKIAPGHRVLCGVHVKNGQRFDRVYRSGDYVRSEDVDMVDPNDNVSTLTYRESGTAKLDSVKGDCGGVYVVNSDAFEHKILGLHYSGTPGQAHFSFFTQEDLQPLIADDFHAAHVTLVKEEEDVPETFPLAENFEFVGTLDKAVVQPLKTSKIPSIIFEKVVPTTVAPSCIRPPLVPDGPMLKGVAKYAGEYVKMEKKHLVSARFSYQSKVAQVSILPRDLKVMSFEEGCMGVPGDEAYPPIKRTKSAGWPYSLSATKGKQKWLGTDEWNLGTPEALQLREDVEKMIEACDQREIPEAYFVDTLKDETRPIEKVKAKKTRVFSAAPMHLTIAVRMYYGGWMAHMYRNRIHMECCCGINSKDSSNEREWTTIAKKLRKFGPKTLIAGDFSNFDGTMQLDLQMEVLKVIQAFYSDGAREQRIRKALWYAMCQSMHIIGPYAYRHSHGQPSGNPTTVYTNSVYNSLAIRYCWSRYFGNCNDFNNSAEVVVYGDDNIISVAPRAQEFDAVQLASQFSSFGMTYTSESKGEQTAQFRNIDEVTFLKREFKWSKEHKLYFAPLALSSILEMTNWVNKELNEVEAVTDNCIYALLELYHHDEETCNYWQPKIVSALREATGYSLPLLSWEEARMNIVAGELDKVYQRQVVRV